MRFTQSMICIAQIALIPCVFSVCVIEPWSGEGGDAGQDTIEDGSIHGPDPTGDTQPTGNRTQMEKIDIWVGNEPHLRGANIHQARAFDDGYLYDGTMEIEYEQQDFDRLSELGANFVNISHPGLYDERAPYGVDTAMQQNLDDLLQMIEQADMFAVIAFRTGPGRNELTFLRDEVNESDAFFTEAQLDESMWSSTVAQQAWVDMWRYVAERYRNSKVVVGYDLMVEPNSNDVVETDYPGFDGWDTDAFNNRFAGTTYDWNELYPDIVDAIREVDSDTPILIGGNGYSGVAWLELLEPVDDSAVVYTVHQYEPISYTHQEPGYGLSYPGTFDVDWDGNADSFNASYLAELLDPVQQFADEHGVPIVFNEMGVVRYAPGAAGYLEDEYELFEQGGWSSAIWMHYSVNGHPGGHAFNCHYGVNSNSSNEVDPNELLTVLRNNWSRNSLRPSNVTFIASTD